MTIDDDRIRRALRGVAEAAPVNDAAAWEQVRQRIDDAPAERQRGRGRTRRVAGLSAAMAVAAAVAGLLLVTGDDDAGRYEVDAGPGATIPEPAPTPDTASPSSTSDVIATPGPVPEHPMAVVLRDDAGGFTGIALYDGDTGEHLGTPVGPTAFSYGDVSITQDGALWFTEEHGDTSAVTRVAWGSTERETPFGDETQAAAVSPDGLLVAYAHHGVTVEDPSVRIVDLASGVVVNELAWRPDDPDFFRTQGSVTALEWSPDGRRLLFVSSYEGSEVLALDPMAASLSDAQPLVDADASTADWVGPDRVVVIDRCCYPDHENSQVRLYDLATGRYEVVDASGRVIDAQASSDGLIALVRTDGTITVDGRVLDVPGAYEIGF